MAIARPGLALLGGAILLVLLVRHWVIRWAEQRYCAYGDLKQAGQPCPGPKKRRAVLIGASISGILAARICADHFDEVVLVDAEDCTTDPSVKRKRVKQHDQLHIFLGLMYPALLTLFPTFLQELQAAGGTIAPPQPVVHRGGGIVKVPCSSQDWDTRQLYVSREVLEALLRKLLLRDHSHVTTLHGTVSDLVAQEDVIQSATLRKATGEVVELAGSVFIDATGTANGSMGWLRKLGYSKPEKLTYDPSIVYTCFTFDVTPEMVKRYNQLGSPYSWQETGHVGACFTADHHSVFMKIDNDRVRTMYQTYVGRGGEPETPEDLLAAVRRAPYQRWQQDAVAMFCGEGLEEAPVYTKSRVNIGQCYKVVYHAHEMPKNLLPLGDTILRVNPIFGQGCTKSIIDIVTLDHTLRRFAGQVPSRELVKYFLDLHYARTDSFWEDTRMQDYANEDTKPLLGETASTGRLYRAFKKWVVQAAQKDQRIGTLLTETTSALRPAVALYEPTFLFRCWIAHLVG